MDTALTMFEIPQDQTPSDPEPETPATPLSPDPGSRRGLSPALGSGTGERSPSHVILIVDDDESVAEALGSVLRSHGFPSILTCHDSREVSRILDAEHVSLVLLDLNMPYRSGQEVLEEIQNRFPDVSVVVVTGDRNIDVVVQCMKKGASDFLAKPVAEARLLATVRNALESSRLRSECARLREQFLADELGDPGCFDEIITACPRMLRLFGYIEAIAASSEPVLVTGETGTGKELIARAIHRAGRGAGEFVAVDVAALDAGMLSDTLFGHQRGAFTGAEGQRAGLIEAAAGGVLFLDEIGDLDETSQVKLLRLIQEREFRPLGSDVDVPLRARIVAATHKTPETLRSDLYYRLRSCHIHVPPLRERTEDLPLLVEAFLEEAARDLDKPKPTVPPELYSYLSAHPFRGNVRELRAMVFDAVARHQRGVLAIRSILDVDSEEAPKTKEDDAIRFPSLLPTLKAIEAAAVSEAMRRCGGNQSAAARLLGVSRPTIKRHLSR